MLAALGMSAFAGLAVLAWLRRRGVPGLVPGGRRRVQVVEAQRLGVKASLVLLRWDDEELLVLQGDGPAQLLARKPACAAAAGAGAAGAAGAGAGAGEALSR